MAAELNPYSCEAPRNLFVDYEALRESILVGLANERNYALIAGYRCGKTSCLIQLKKDLEQRAGHIFTLPCYVNMKDVRPNTEIEFFNALWSSLTEAFEIDPLRETECSGSNRNSFFGYRRLASLLDAKYGPEWLVIWLIDELDSITDNARSIQLLRRMLTEEPHRRRFRLVATGGSSMAQLTGEGSLLNLTPRYLRRLAVTAADQLIGKGLKLKPDQRAEIRELTGRHPYLLQAFLSILYETRSEKWTPERVRMAVRDVTRDRLGTFRRWISSIGPKGRDLYQVLANEGGSLDGEVLRRRVKLGLDFDATLNILEYHGIVESDTSMVRTCGRIFFEWFQASCEIGLQALPPADSVKDRSRAIFVVHGRDARLRIAMYQFLRALGLHPLEWTEIKEQTDGPNPYVGDILETGFLNSQAVVVLLTGDDEARLKEQHCGRYDFGDERALRPQPRANVLFEAGFAMARFPKATILVQIGELRGISDIAGRHLIRMNNSRPARTELAKALQKAGCDIAIDTSNAWVDAGNFDEIDS